MGLGGLFRKLLGGDEPPPETLEGEYEESDDELRALWARREALPPKFASELRCEFALRGLPLPPDRPAPHRPIRLFDPAVIPDEDDLAPAPAPGLVQPLGGAAALLGGELLCLLPPWHPRDQAQDRALRAAREAGARFAVLLAPPSPQAVAAAPQAPALSPQAVAAALGIDPAQVLVAWEALPATLGAFQLRAAPGGLRVVHEERGLDALVGAAVPLESLPGAPPTQLVGGLRWPTTDAGLETLSEGWRVETSAALRDVLVLGDAAGVAGAQTRAIVEELPARLRTAATRLEAAVESQPLLAAALSDAWEALGALAADADAVAPAVLGDAVGYLLFVGDLDRAEAALDVLDGARPGVGELAFARGELLALRGDRAGAVAAYERAAACDPPYGRAFCNVAVYAAEDGDLAGVLRATGQAAETLAQEVTAGGGAGDEAEGGSGEPERAEKILSHPIALANRALALWKAGEQADAVAMVQAAALDVSPWTRSLLEITTDEGDPATHPLLIRPCRFYTVAAWEAARAVFAGGDGDAELAQALLRRVVALDPVFVEAAATLSDVLWARGEREEALGVLDAALARSPLTAPLLAVRAARRAEVEDWDGAVADYDRALSLAGDLAPLRANLVLALAQRGAQEAVAEQLRELEREGTDERVVKALRRAARFLAARREAGGGGA